MGEQPAVERVDVAAYTIPTDQPEADGTLAWSSTTMVYVEVAGGGRTGIGWTYAAAACAPLVRDVLAEVVCGRPVLDVPGAWEAMVRTCRNLGRPGLVSCAVAAVDVALWDLKAKLFEVPLCRLLGSARGEVPVYGSGGFTTYDDDRTRAQLSRWVHELGIPRVKIKIGESWGTCAARDLARVRLAREVIGDGAELYVDANGGYSRKQAVRIARAFADADVRWFEEPVSSDDLAGLGVVRDAIDVDVAAGEYGCDLVYFARMVPVVDCVQVDVSRCAGISEWLRIAALVAAHGLTVSAHCCPHLHAHVTAAVPNLRHIEWFHDHVRLEEMLFDGTLDPSGGAIRPDQGRPGLGVTLRRGDAERFRVA